MDFKFNNFKKIDIDTRRVLLSLASHIFLVIICLFVIEIIFGLFLIYRYGILVEMQQPGTSIQKFQFEEEKYNKVLEQIKNREEKFNLITDENFPNPFKTQGASKAK